MPHPRIYYHATCDPDADDGLVHVAKLKLLTSLNLADCIAITDLGLAHVAKIEQLSSLNLADCKYPLHAC